MHSCEHWALCEHNQATIEHFQSHFTHWDALAEMAEQMAEQVVAIQNAAEESACDSNIVIY